MEAGPESGARSPEAVFEATYFVLNLLVHTNAPLTVFLSSFWCFSFVIFFPAAPLLCGVVVGFHRFSSVTVSQSVCLSSVKYLAK